MTRRFYGGPVISPLCTQYVRTILFLTCGVYPKIVARLLYIQQTLGAHYICTQSILHQGLLLIPDLMGISFKPDGSINGSPSHARLKNATPNRIRRAHTKCRFGCQQCKKRRMKVAAPGEIAIISYRLTMMAICTAIKFHLLLHFGPVIVADTGCSAT